MLSAMPAPEKVMIRTVSGSPWSLEARLCRRAVSTEIPSVVGSIIILGQLVCTRLCGRCDDRVPPRWVEATPEPSAFNNICRLPVPGCRFLGMASSVPLAPKSRSAPPRRGWIAPYQLPLLSATAPFACQIPPTAIIRSAYASAIKAPCNGLARLRPHWTDESLRPPPGWP